MLTAALPVVAAHMAWLPLWSWMLLMLRWLMWLFHSGDLWMCLSVWLFLEVSRRLLLLLYCLIVASVTAVIGVGLVVIS